MDDVSHPMNFLLTEDLDINLPKAGQIRRGTVVEQANNSVLVDIGAKSEGLIPNSEWETLDTVAREQLSVGKDVYVYVVDPEDENGNIILSYSKAAEEQDWQTAHELHSSQDTYQGQVVGFNKGGLLVRVGRLRGFVPVSQLGTGRQVGRPDTSADYLRKMVGETLYLKAIEVDRERNRLILSERAAAKEIREAQRSNLLRDLQEGDIREGKVVNLTDFGAFVDIGGIEGLIHLSELSWKRVVNPAEILKLGDQVTVYVLSVERDRQRIALSMKRLENDVWHTIDEVYRVGQLVEATITKLTKFGAFARLTDGYQLEGLIHISELAEGHVNHPRDAVKPGQLVTLRIIRIDQDQRQLGLSIRQVTSDKFMASDLADVLGEKK